MFLLFLDRLLGRWPTWDALHGLEKITLRASLAAVFSFAIAIACGPRSIRWLQARFREPIKIASPAVAALHQAKQATPTMGGIFIVAGLLLSTLACGDWTNPYLPIAALLVIALGGLGACDDLIKLRTVAPGLRARTKLVAQILIALAISALVFRAHLQLDHALSMQLPFAQHSLTLGWLFVPLATLIIVAFSNAVNLTDGLDGLAGGCLICATGAMALVTYASGHAGWAGYLNIPHIAGSGELVVLAAGAIGGLLGFLWFNCFPASVFMGDTGSLPLGGLLGLLAVVAREEFLLLAIGGVFVIEAASVVAQVASFRWRRKRVLLCAPLHHHFQLKGLPEDKIVVRFWIAAALCAIAGLAGLKAGVQEAASYPQVTKLERVTASQDFGPR